MIILMLLTLAKIALDLRLLQLCREYTPQAYPIEMPLTKDGAA